MGVAMSSQHEEKYSGDFQEKILSPREENGEGKVFPTVAVLLISGLECNHDFWTYYSHLESMSDNNVEERQSRGMRIAQILVITVE